MEFPYPTTISRDDFQDPEFVPDKFLYENHRFTSLDVLIKDLSVLHESLNSELMSIVNNDYDEFIKLGKSIDGGENLINEILNELKQFQKLCANTKSHLQYSHTSIQEALDAKFQLIRVKNQIKLCVLLNSQLENFEQLLEYEDLRKDLKTHIKNLTTIYLSINKLWKLLNGNDCPSNYLSALKGKVINLGSEYKSYLREVMNKNRENGDVMLQLMLVYNVIGNEKEFIQQTK